MGLFFLKQRVYLLYQPKQFLGVLFLHRLGAQFHPKFSFCRLHRIRRSERYWQASLPPNEVLLEM